MQANPRRIARVTKAMEREISNIMVTDDVVRDAITRNDGVTMCTCSGVDVSGDLQVVKVYIVVQSRDERARYAITKRLQGLTGCVHACCHIPRWPEPFAHRREQKLSSLCVH